MTGIPSPVPVPLEDTGGADDNWADQLHAMRPPPPPVRDVNVLAVPCPVCHHMIEVLADDRVNVAMRPAAKGDGWATFDVTITAAGRAMHTHNR